MNDFQISGAQMSIVFILQYKDKAIALWGSEEKSFCKQATITALQTARLYL